MERKDIGKAGEQEEKDAWIENGYLYMTYKDETWGSCRHWQTVCSLKEVESEDHARAIIDNKENSFKACWEFEVVKKEFNDSRRNRHRHCIYRAKLETGKTYLLRIYKKVHPSCNRLKWYRKFTYYLISDAENMKLMEDRTVEGI